MSERKELQPGCFCWPELATPDATRAKAFYAGLFGWNPVDVPSAGGTYNLLQLRGLDATALRTLSDRDRASLCSQHLWPDEPDARPAPSHAQPAIRPHSGGPVQNNRRHFPTGLARRHLTLETTENSSPATQADTIVGGIYCS